MRSHVLHIQALHKLPVLPCTLRAALSWPCSRWGLGPLQRIPEALIGECLVHAAGWPPQSDDQCAYYTTSIPANQSMVPGSNPLMRHLYCLLTSCHCIWLRDKVRTAQQA